MQRAAHERDGWNSSFADRIACPPAAWRVGPDHRNSRSNPRSRVSAVVAPFRRRKGCTFWRAS